MNPSNADAYLTLLRQVLTGYASPQEYSRFDARHPLKRLLLGALNRVLSVKGLRVARYEPFDPEAREMGRDYPVAADTMVGLRRLENLDRCIRTIAEEGVPGDLIETGVWRGGAVIYMRAAARARGLENRTVWVADSFRGLPKPDVRRYPADEGDLHWKKEILSVSSDEVRERFRKYGLLDGRVRFLEGWFENTLPSAPIERLALLRLDGDMYASTIQPLEALYHKVSPGGFVIVDDYHAVEACRRAVDEFRATEGIEEPLLPVDDHCVYWRRSPSR